MLFPQCAILLLKTVELLLETLQPFLEVVSCSDRLLVFLIE